MAHIEGPSELTPLVMNWRPLVRFLPFALLIDGAAAYVGWLIWRIIT
jgi:hypothetical protein